MTRKPNIFVSDHALVRYLERHHLIDLAPLRQQIRDLVEGPIGVGAKNFKWQGINFAFVHQQDGSVHVATVLERAMGTSKLQNKKLVGKEKS